VEVGVDPRKFGPLYSHPLPSSTGILMDRLDDAAFEAISDFGSISRGVAMATYILSMLKLTSLSCSLLAVDQ